MKKLLISTLIAGAMAGSLFAQGTVSFQGTATYPVRFSIDQGTTINSVAVGNPAALGTYGNLNIQVYYAPVGTASPFTATTASLIPSTWTASSSTPLHQVGPLAGWTPSTVFTLANANPSVSANEEVMVVGWSGSFADWNSAFSSGTALLGWSGSTLSGGALEWSNGLGNPNGSPPTTPVGLVTGAGGYNGLVLLSSVPEPSTMALAGLGAAALLIFRRRK